MNQKPQAAENVLAVLCWKRVTWRRGTKGALAARFAALRVRVPMLQTLVSGI